MHVFILIGISIPCQDKCPWLHPAAPRADHKELFTMGLCWSDGRGSTSQKWELFKAPVTGSQGKFQCEECLWPKEVSLMVSTELSPGSWLGELLPTNSWHWPLLLPPELGQKTCSQFWPQNMSPAGTWNDFKLEFKQRLFHQPAPWVKSARESFPGVIL